MKLGSYTMTLHASMTNNILLYTSKTLCPLSAYSDWYHCSIEDPKNDSLSRQDFGSFGVTFLWIESHFSTATDPFSQHPLIYSTTLLNNLEYIFCPSAVTAKAIPHPISYISHYYRSHKHPLLDSVAAATVTFVLSQSNILCLFFFDC